MGRKYANLFESVKIANCQIKNRFAMAPMGPGGLCDAEGGWNQRGIQYYTERAKGGTGLIITGVTFVENKVEFHPMPSVGCPTHNPIHFTRTSKELTERVHAYNAKIFLQLSGGFGRVTIPTNIGDAPPVAPSAIPHRWLDHVICRELTVEEIKYIVQKFGESAAIAKRAGFDGIEIHAVHEGYLIDQFAIALFNHRTDEYGGSLKNRLRFAVEILEEIKRTCGADYPVILRYSPKSFIKDLRAGGLPGEVFEEKGRDLAEGVEAIKILEAAGYDAFDIDVGSYDAWYWSHPPMYQEKGLYLPYAEICKQNVKVPVITAGRMDNPELASTAVAAGKTDMVSLGRPLLADPFLVNKIAANQTAKIRPCLSCQEGCMGRLQEYCALGCAVNPACCRENEMAIIPATVKKNMVVIGGGIAGCEAARVLAERGHKVTLFEKSRELGGNLIPGGAPDFKEDDHALVAWYKQELEALAVDIRYNTEITAGMAMSFQADAVIVATGSVPKIMNLGNQELICAAEDVLLGKRDPGARAVVVGGGLVGCETALMLARQGKKVVIVEALPRILNNGAPLCHANSSMLEDLMPFNGIEVRTSTKVVRTTTKGIIVAKDGVETEIPADSVILSIGYHSNNTLYEQIKDSVDNVYLLGDARQVANIMYAIWDAFELSRTF
ncbi:pyridine nucleotide disulphide reductase class-i signature [Lucifera butyrica]|uniref:Pyridine nucleotide disulphide reductase class-i signature n=1 Tax=Lucifera butyrica TaxID=1351585 RepID=A0A498R778_9FIRM|nr:FAD-dependent oxidoreductase [Lucifera butyrica]VBB07059.1 pyridine nucleotide disulphide reductase class-i signature [Lucifera butyrica]